MHNFTSLNRYILLIISLVLSYNVHSQCGVGETVTTYPYNESFEGGGSIWFVNTWYQGAGDDGDWRRDNFGTPSGGTGPANASDGTIYVYTEASFGDNPGNPGNLALLESPCFDLTGFTTPVFSFDYHMAGANMGDLKVQVSTNNGTTWADTGWFRNGAQQADSNSPWLTGTINLNAYIGQTIRLRFHGTTGTTWLSDMAIDNINFIDDIPTPEINVVGLGNTIPDGDTTPVATDNTDFGDFNIPSAPTVHTFTIQNTGAGPLNLTGAPLVQITGAAAGDYAVTTVPTSPVPAGGSTTFSISFSASAAGARNATVTIANNDANENPYNFDITGNGIVPPSCPGTIVNTYPYTEGFEAGLGAWIQGVNGTDDDLDWTRLNAPTPSTDTGPSGAIEGSWYLFTEASGNTNRLHFLDSPCFDLTGLAAPGLSFSYHMYGATMGTLKVQISTNNGATWVDTGWTRTGQEQTSATAAWTNAVVDLSPYIGQTVRLRFHGLTGTLDHRSDMAFDGVSVGEVTIIPPPQYTIFYENFDANNGGWTSSNQAGRAGNWVYDTTTTPLVAEGGYWRTDPWTNYPGNSGMYLTSPTAISTSGFTNVTFYIDIRHSTEAGRDGMQIQYTTDPSGLTGWTRLGNAGQGARWYNDIDTDGIANNEHGWSGVNAGDGMAGRSQFVEAKIADAALDNQASLRFRVLFGSDNTTTGDGAAIDNVIVKGNYITAPADPAIGPGDVTANLKLWLKSNTGTSTAADNTALASWGDQAYDNDAISYGTFQPVYKDNATDNLNFNPIVDFTAANSSQMKGKGGFFTQDYFMVLKPNAPITNATRQQPLAGKYIDFGFSVDGTGIAFGLVSSRYTNSLIAHTISSFPQSGPPNNTSYGRAYANTTPVDEEVMILNIKTNATNTITEIYLNGVQIDNQTGLAGNGSPLNFNQIDNLIYHLGVGRFTLNNFVSSHFDGKIAELISYSSQNSAADQQKIYSYLALKYGATYLSAGNIIGARLNDINYVDSDGTVIWDSSANAGFNYDVAGIGRDDDSGLNQKQSSSIQSGADGIGPTEGLLTMGLTEIYDTNNENITTNTNTLNDKEFLTWGSNNGDLNLSNMINVDLSSGIAGLSTPVTFESTQRVWKVVETGGDVGEVKVRIPVSALRGVSPPGDFYMFISDSNMFDPTATYRVMRPSVSDPTVLEGNYDFNGIKFITFGYAEEITRVRSVYFDGAVDFIDMEDNLDLNPAGFTVSAWIKRDAATNNASIVSKRNAGYTSGYDLRLNGTSHVQVQWLNGGNQSLTSSIPIPQDEWHHVAVTYNGTNAKIYIDGVLDTNANLAAPLDTDESFYIAAAGKNTPTDYFGGNIDEVRVWDTELNVDQLRYVMNQEIQDNAGMADGVVLPTAITQNDIGAIPWNQLAGYYPMTRYTYTNTKDESGNDNIGALRNLNTVDFQTAPLPYESNAAGSWSADATWLNNTVQTLPNAVSIVDGTTPVNWNIVRTNHDVMINTETTLGRQRQVLGLFVDSNTLTVDGATVSGTGNALTVSHYLRIDGKLDLNGESQLIQTLDSDFEVLSSGTLERDQQGTEDLYTYNYWASPVGVSNTTSNNNSYTVPDIFFDGTNPATPLAINFITGGYDGTNGSPIGLADYWIWKFSNLPSDDYSEWQHVRSTGTLLAGEGFTLKGVSNTGGVVSNEQNYVYDGKPNNGDITLSITSGNDYLVGNPYPSAIDAIQFINDNGTSTTGTLYFWEHWGGGSHVLGEYQGGYATYNLSGGAPASGNDPDVGTGGTPTKTPGQFIPVAQGFFVTSLSSGTIEFNNGQRFYEKEGASSIFVRKGNPNAPTASSSKDNRMKIRVGFNSINGLHRQLLVTQDSRATPGIDWGFDGELTEEQIDDMYWMIENQKFVIQGIDVVNKYLTLPLGIHTRDSGDNTFTIDDLINVPDELEIYIHDKETELYHDLRANDFTINLLAGEYLTRFEIAFMNGAIVLDNDNIEAIETNIELYYSNTNNTIVISNPSLEILESIELFNILGQSIVKFDDVETINHSEIKLKTISSGNYIVKLKTENGEISKKVLIN